MLVFSEQNVIKDPPFSKLDLISCRNLPIYMGETCRRSSSPSSTTPEPGGFLFLGTSGDRGEFYGLLWPRWTAT